MTLRNAFTTSDNHKGLVGKQHVRSREKTPKWLNNSRNMRDVQSEEYDQDLENERKAFFKTT